ncbi:hypothetical protein BKH43_02295 [Helicobacter sp. 13S00401-1]|uniref:hypothetical protein n=1 Tax=Helicobacter sp. 13S00401-1 TaxID=1905758 RepID=UPI000BA789B8|nr:hypothetical protein [Helicobacter sp. 13S00401-1]PAF51060.1 hypothetical protein BKH43_02295 [Helicobacter sp. 13S00401-1]
MEQDDKQTKLYQELLSQNDDLQDEIRDLEAQIFDLLQVSLHFAGVKKDYMQEALEGYMELLGEEKDDAEYSVHEIIALIKKMKAKSPHFFNK